SSSSGPQGRGGTAYPSGTPPYGSRQYPSLHPQEAPPGGDAADADVPAAPAAEGPRTETTLTTRVRINIPGSRPIPPVVVRTPVADADTANTADTTDTADEAGAETTQTTTTVSAPSILDRPAEPAAQAEGKPSDQFAPA